MKLSSHLHASPSVIGTFAMSAVLRQRDTGVKLPKYGNLVHFAVIKQRLDMLIAGLHPIFKKYAFKDRLIIMTICEKKFNVIDVNELLDIEGGLPVIPAIFGVVAWLKFCYEAGQVSSKFI